MIDKLGFRVTFIAMAAACAAGGCKRKKKEKKNKEPLMIKSTMSVCGSNQY